MYFKGTYLTNEVFGPGRYFNMDDIDAIIEGSLEILSKIGLKLIGDSLRQQVAAKGFRLKGDRVLIEKKVAREYFEMWRKQPSKMRSLRRYNFDKNSGFNCTLNEHCTNLLYNKNLEPFTMESLVDMTKLIEKLSVDYNFTPNAAGCPSDIPFDLESLARFMVAAKYCHEGYPDEPETVVAADYMFRMAEVMGYEIKRLTVFVSTLLTLGGESLEIVTNFKDRVPLIKVTSMPSFGANTPHNIPAAFSVALAEVLGSAVVVNSLTEVFCDFLVQMHPFDFRALNFVFGSPEHLIMEWINGEFNSRLVGKEYYPRRTNIHTHAKVPGFQSAVEKTSLVMAGALNGAVVFNGAGALSLDDIFSPMQLILDLEILSHVWRAVRGARKETLPENLLETVSAGIDGSYTASELTLDNISEFIWYSDIFDRFSLASAKEKRDSEQSKINDILEKYKNKEESFVLDEQKVQELDRIWERALSDSRVRN